MFYKDKVYDIPKEINHTKIATQAGGRGKHCFVMDCPEAIKNRIGRSDNSKLLLKVFFTILFNPVKKIEDYKWGDDPIKGGQRKNTRLLDATIIQNLMVQENLASRVYAWVTVNYKGKVVLAQVVDKLGYGESKTIDGEVRIADFQKTHDQAIAVGDKVKKLGEKYGFKMVANHFSKWDEIDSKLIDFQMYELDKNYYDKTKELYREGTKWGKIYYQPIPEMGLNKGPRDMQKRIREMQLDKIDFENKTVLDIGCSGGDFVRYVLDNGAKRAVGLDETPVANGARAMANAMKYWNADFYGVDLNRERTESLRKKTEIEKFDIVFYLSMFRHVHFPSFIWEMCKEKSVIEWNNWKTEDEILNLVKEKFNVEIQGRTTDHGEFGKPFYISNPK